MELSVKSAPPKPTEDSASQLSQLSLGGELHTGSLMRRLYATDASEYQELPLAVAIPADEEDVRRLVQFAARTGIPLIPRTAGTSLAGQVVGSGVVMDLGRNLNRILEIDGPGRRVRVQPGVVRFDLNHALLSHGMLFGPETSTANRAMIGGMVGNNSCGSNSVVYGSTRDHLLSCRGFLSDGSEVTFGPLKPDEFEAKCTGNSLEAEIYRTCRDMLSDSGNRELIRENYPKRSIPRRNTGYALDLLMDANVFDPESERPFNLCRLICGSEGTLFVGVEFELNCVPLPPPFSGLLCAHFPTVHEALNSVSIALGHSPSAVELIDHHILDATKRNMEQLRNRFFVEGDPGAILVIDIRRNSEADMLATRDLMVEQLKAAGLGYSYPFITGEDQNKIWELRRAGQALMTNIPGDTKPREIVEDTAVDVADLPAYIEEFDRIMRERHGIECVYYAHAGSGELHTRPLFNLKTPEGLKTFRSVAEDIAALVKKYRGSLSGEHGDGRLRGEFIPFMVGDACYALMRQIKQTFDPRNIFNPGKIIDTPPMDTALRYSPDVPNPEYETIFDFSESLGVLRAAEQCNGSGDCRKSFLAGGTMCPSYMATRNEKHTTRARANIVRQVLTHPDASAKNPFDSQDISEAMDLCLSCKACKSECPSSVDIAKLKAEFLQHYYDANGTPLRAKIIAGFAQSSRLASMAPWAWNFIFKTAPLRRIANRLVGFHPDRTIPLLHSTTLKGWYAARKQRPNAGTGRKVYLFADEFTDFSDVPIGIKTIELLEALGYDVVIPRHTESGRASLSKGLLRNARKIAQENIRALSPIVSADAPLIGIEPSALLTFRDEYIDLAPPALRDSAQALALNCLMFEEFIAREFAEGRIRKDQFISDPRQIKLHGHCFQKALASLVPIVQCLEIPENYDVQLIPSGCCGMAGSFGYEAEHYEVSMKVGELVLFPSVRNAASDVIIAAAGTSCRHQIHDGTHRTALHPAEILHAALKQR